MKRQPAFLRAGPRARPLQGEARSERVGNCELCTLSRRRQDRNFLVAPSRRPLVRHIGRRSFNESEERVYKAVRLIPRRLEFSNGRVAIVMTRHRHRPRLAGIAATRTRAKEQREGLSLVSCENRDPSSR